MPQCRNGNKCCCEVCTTERLSCDDCCRCVPRSFCITFEADDPYCECDGKGARAFRDEETGIYEASLDCDGQSIDVTLFTEVLYGECVWRLISESAGVDDYFEIRGEYGVGCEDPVFEFEADFYGCGGTVTIRRYEGAKVKFEPPCDYFCGQCRCTCQSLCAVEWIDNEPQEPVRWDWDEDRRAWGDEYNGASLARSEDGGCLIVVDGEEFPLELCDEIEVNTVDEYGNGYVLTCWECSCDPSGDDLVQSTCCGKDPMPRTLYATVERVSDAALCGDHTTEVVPLTWQGVQPHPNPLRSEDTLYWTADISFGDCGTTKIAFFCDGTDCVPTPSILCSTGVIYSLNAVGGTGNRLACVDELSCSCDPYYGEFTILPFDAGLSCPNVNCAFKVTISE